MSIIEMVVRSRYLHADTMTAAAMRRACGLDGIDVYKAKRRRHGVGTVDRDRDRRDIKRLMSQRTGALDRVR